MELIAKNAVSEDWDSSFDIEAGLKLVYSL